MAFSECRRDKLPNLYSILDRGILKVSDWCGITATDTEYETEEDSEDSSTDGETTETETDTLAGTPRGK